MVFSNEEMKRKFNLNGLDANKSDLDYMLRQDQYRPVDVTKKFNEFIDEHYYTGRFDGLDEKYGINPNTLGLFLIRIMQYHMADDITNCNAIKEKFNKIREEKNLIYMKAMNSLHVTAHILAFRLQPPFTI